MIVRTIDAGNDWTFGKGRNSYRKNIKAVEQLLQTRLQSFLGDCFFDIQEGLDWFNLLGSKNQLALELAVRTVILNTEGVTGIVSFSTSLNSSTRVFSMQYTVNTIYTGGVDAGLLTSTSSLILTEDGDVLTTEDGDGILAG